MSWLSSVLSKASGGKIPEVNLLDFLKKNKPILDREIQRAKDKAAEEVVKAISTLTTYADGKINAALIKDTAYSALVKLNVPVDVASAASNYVAAFDIEKYEDKAYGKLQDIAAEIAKGIKGLKIDPVPTPAVKEETKK